MPNIASLTDSALMRQIATGDTDAFDELYRRHVRRSWLLARRLGAPADLADDVVQDAFVSLWRRSGQYRPERGSVNAWLATIVRNHVTDTWRRAGARPTEVAEEYSPELVAGASDLPQAERLAVRQVVATLPEGQRDAIVLSYFGGLTHEQIAARCGWPLGTVKGRLRLGMDKLRVSMVA